MLSNWSPYYFEKVKEGKFGKFEQARHTCYFTDFGQANDNDHFTVFGQVKIIYTIIYA